MSRTPTRRPVWPVLHHPHEDPAPHRRGGYRRFLAGGRRADRRPDCPGT